MVFHHLHFVGHLLDFCETFHFNIMELLLLFKNTYFKLSHVTFHLSQFTHFLFETDDFIFQFVVVWFILWNLFIQYVTLWAVAWNKVVDAIATVTRSSSVFLNKTSSSWIYFIVPSFCFSFQTLFRLTSFLYRLKVKDSKIYSML